MSWSEGGWTEKTFPDFFEIEYSPPPIETLDQAIQNEKEDEKSQKIASKILHARNLPTGTQKSDLEAVVNEVSEAVKILRFKDQALIEFESKSEAEKVLSHFENKQVKIGDLQIYFAFSRSQEITEKSSESNKKQNESNQKRSLPSLSNGLYNPGENQGKRRGLNNGHRQNAANNHPQSDHEILLRIATKYLRQYNLPYAPENLNINSREHRYFDGSSWRGRRRNMR
mmetsp:Transcript_20222/g.29877  ORF Transcript_20222/g.29877 Transcript_20222/m.29877 type:complete len:227 (+) Transcript_20222:194-874(+)